MRSRFVSSLVASFLVCGIAQAQSLALFDGAGVVTEFSGPPDPAVCFYPTGFGVAFPPAPACGPGLVPIPAGAPGVPGGVTYDSVTDLFFVSDGGLVESYTSAGVFVDSWIMPLPVFGLGIDSAAGLLWATDGAALLYAVAIPPVGTCGAPVPVAIAPFPAPFPGAPLSGIDWDPLSGSLWVCDVAGIVTNVLPGGAPGPIAPFPYPAIPGPCWGVPPPTYMRLACDKGSPFGPGHLYLTDGFIVASILPGGAPAPPTFAFPGPGAAPCFPTTVPTVGIGYTSHGTPYGVGTDPDGLAPPMIGSLGSSITPSPGFTITLAGAVPFSPVALLFLTFTTPGGMPGYACPPFPALGVLSLLNPLQPVSYLGSVPTGPGGGAAFALPIPPGVAGIGAEFFVQWFVFKPFGPSMFQASDGLEFRIALP